MYWICALILPRCTQESVVIYGHLLRYCVGAKYWYWLGNTAKVLVFVLQYWLKICIGIGGIGNTFSGSIGIGIANTLYKFLLTTLPIVRQGVEGMACGLQGQGETFLRPRPQFCLSLRSRTVSRDSVRFDPLRSMSPPYKGIKFGYQNVRFLLLSTNLARERLQIDTDLLRIITSTADDLSGVTNIDDLERPWNPKIVFLWIFPDFRLRRTFKEWTFVEITGDRPRQHAL